MNIVVLERSSVGMDVSIDCFNELGNVTAYNNTAFEEIAERIKDADIVVANKSRLNDTDFRWFKIILYGLRGLLFKYTLKSGLSPKLQDAHLIVSVSQFVHYH